MPEKIETNEKNYEREDELMKKMRKNTSAVAFWHLAGDDFAAGITPKMTHDLDIYKAKVRDDIAKIDEASKKDFLKKNPEFEQKDLPLVFLRIKKVIEQVKTVKAVFEDEIEEVEKEKKQAISLIRDVMEKSLDYALSIEKQTRVKEMMGDSEKLLDALISSDLSRKLAHNALMDALKIANRYMIQRFAKIPQVQIDRIREKIEEKGGALPEVERVEFEGGLSAICGDPNINLENRRSVAVWALKMLEGTKILGKKNSYEFLSAILEN